MAKMDDWELVVKPGRKYRFRLQNHQRKLHITEAIMDDFPKPREKNMVRYSIGGQIPVNLCEISPDDTICSLSHVIESEEDTVEFWVTGETIICLTGVTIDEEQTATVRASELQSPNIANNSMFRSGNMTHRVFERRIRNPPPGACVNRRFYENILPSSTLYDVKEGPKEEEFLKFTDDGQYIISYQYHQQSVIVYRASWCSYPSSLLGSSPASNFCSYATRLHSTKIGGERENEHCAGFFLHVPDHDYGIFASSSGPFANDLDEWANLQLNDYRSVYSTRSLVMDTIRFYLIRLCDGTVIDRIAFENDHIRLRINEGAHLCDNILALTSSRNQRIMTYEVGPGGFTHKRNVDYTWINEEQLFPQYEHSAIKCFPKAQLLDSDHVLIKFGSDTSGVVNNLHAIYNMVTLDAVPFFEEKGSYEFFDKFGELLTLNVTDYNDISSSHTRHTLNIAQLMSIRNNKRLFSRTVEHLLLEFPFECQLKTPSPYFEPSHFKFDDDMPWQGMSHNYYPRRSGRGRGWHSDYTGETLNFVSLKHPLKQKFTIKAGKEHEGEEYYLARASVLIHPQLPLMISFLDHGLGCINIHRR